MKTAVALPSICPARTSRLEWVTLPHTSLGVLRRFGVYLPAGCGEAGARFPVLYLFRGHETEWAGDQDGREGLVRVLDRAIARRAIEPLIVVLPGFTSPDRHTQGCPIDWSAPGEARGVGNGRFEAHFFEIKAHVESHLPARIGRQSCALDGFSMGGWSSIYLATKYPHLFASAGAYDGSFMWPRQIDPRRKPHGRADRLWFSDSCRPFFCDVTGRWDEAKMERHNPLRLVAGAAGRRLLDLRTLRFHVRSVPHEGVGNIDRARLMIAGLKRAGIENTFTGADVVLHPGARHDWRWADVHLEGTLRLHDAAFRAPVP
jgi:S-formylglutathione hydrolase FrmB